MAKWHLGFFAFFAPLLAQAVEVEKSWEKAVVFEPETAQRASIGALSLDKRFPVLVFLHGCTGLYPDHPSDHFSWAELVAKEGFVVVMPDSFARPGRIPNCVPGKPGEAGRFRQADNYRQDEIAFALSNLNSVSWADPKNLFLMGHSEGAIATATTRHPGFRGLIISGWTCTHSKNPRYDGIFSPKEVPALAIAFKDDPFRKGRPQEGRCANKADGRELTQVDLEGSSHGTYSDPNARTAVQKFLREKLQQ